MPLNKTPPKISPSLENCPVMLHCIEKLTSIQEIWRSSFCPTLSHEASAINVSISIGKLLCTFVCRVINSRLTNLDNGITLYCYVGVVLRYFLGDSNTKIVLSVVFMYECIIWSEFFISLVSGVVQYIIFMFINMYVYFQLSSTL